MKPVLVAPLPPVNAMTLATAGSFLITPPICWMELFIAGKEESCGPCTAAGDRSGILLREKALGYLDDQHHVERDGEEQHRRA